MKRQCFFLFCLLAGMGAVLAATPLLVGHRGSDLGVENTAPAFRAGALVRGYDGLECDVRVTADGHYVISHDETTTRLGGDLTVAQATLAQLRAETYTQTRRGVTYTGHLCTVEEFLDICVSLDVFPIIELKWSTGINNNDMSRFDGLARLVTDKGLAGKAVFLTSMKRSLEHIRTHYPHFKCQWLCNDNWRENVEWCDRWRLNPSIRHGCFDAETVRRFAGLGLECAVWTVDDPDTGAHCAAMGVAVITTNALWPAVLTP